MAHYTLYYILKNSCYILYIPQHTLYKISFILIMVLYTIYYFLQPVRYSVSESVNSSFIELFSQYWSQSVKQVISRPVTQFLQSVSQ